MQTEIGNLPLSHPIKAAQSLNRTFGSKPKLIDEERLPFLNKQLKQGEHTQAVLAIGGFSNINHSQEMAKGFTGRKNAKSVYSVNKEAFGLKMHGSSQLAPSQF